MRILKAIAISFSLYSKIPMPQFLWEDEEMKLSLIFFPWVGAMIGFLSYGWTWIYVNQIGRLPFPVYLLILMCLPLLVSGGFHVDGYMDLQDARHSYASREKKLEILKDPHIGAFSVIMLARLGILELAALWCLAKGLEQESGLMNSFAMTGQGRALLLLFGGFYLSRILSALSLLYFPKAKKDGMLAKEAQVKELPVKVGLYLQLLLCFLYFLWISYVGAIVLGALSLLCLIYYRKMTDKEFGGITGDTAGWFLVHFELLIALLLAFLQFLPWEVL